MVMYRGAGFSLRFMVVEFGHGRLRRASGI